jgi:hypothetical protein
LFQEIVKSCFCLSGSACKAPIGTPVHPRWLSGEGIERARTAAEPQSDLLRLTHGAAHRIFLLAFVGKAAAMPARE